MKRTIEQHQGESTLAADGRPKVAHVEFLINNKDWPNWPLCPVKRNVPKEHKDYPQQIGTVVAGETEVYLANMYRVSLSHPPSAKLVYDTFAAMVDDGWLVD